MQVSTIANSPGSRRASGVAAWLVRDPDIPTTQSLLPRKEIFPLGARHRGDALAGALVEREEADLSAERRTLLRAVVTHLSRGRQNDGSGGDANPIDRRYAILLAVACIFGAVQIWSLFH